MQGPLQTMRGPYAAWRTRQDGCHAEMCSPARMQNCNPRNVTDVIDIVNTFANLILWHLMVKSCFCFSHLSFIENTSRPQKCHFSHHHLLNIQRACEVHTDLDMTPSLTMAALVRFNFSIDQHNRTEFYFFRSHFWWNLKVIQLIAHPATFHQYKWKTFVFLNDNLNHHHRIHFLSIFVNKKKTNFQPQTKLFVVCTKLRDLPINSLFVWV